MTGEERKLPVELTDASDRAVMAGLTVRLPDDDQRSLEVTCRLCGATLAIPATPWRPVEAARRLDSFAVRHLDHGGLDHGGLDHDGTAEEV
jgi:hypothetical protein